MHNCIRALACLQGSGSVKLVNFPDGTNVSRVAVDVSREYWRGNPS